MSPSVASLVALLLAIALSFSARVNVGVAALAPTARSPEWPGARCAWLAATQMLH